MSDPLLIEIRAAGEVPPPPDRDAAFARAMAAVTDKPSRMRRGLTVLTAAALLAVPAGVFQTVGHLTRRAPPVVRVQQPEARHPVAGTARVRHPGSNTNRSGGIAPHPAGGADRKDKHKGDQLNRG